MQKLFWLRLTDEQLLLLTANWIHFLTGFFLPVVLTSCHQEDMNLSLSAAKFIMVDNLVKSSKGG